MNQFALNQTSYCVTRNARPFAHLQMRSSLRQTRRRVCHPPKAAEAAVTSSTEQEALQAYRAQYGVNVGDCLKVLQQAAATKSIAPQLVEGGLIHLESAAQGSTPPDFTRPWKLVFGTASKIRQLQYIPVNEDFVVDVQAKTVGLKSFIGPFGFHVKGILYSYDKGCVDFQLDQGVDISFLNNKLTEVKAKGKRKTYTFFHADDKIACARSSTGGVALLAQR